MPTIAQEKYCRLYRIDYLVTKKSYTEKRTQRSIYSDLMSLLDCSRSRLWRLRRFQPGDPGGLSTEELIQLANYFQCSLDDLVVKDESASSALSPETSPESAEEAGAISFTPQTPLP